MERKLKKVLKYFSFFAYHPTLDEVYVFFPEKISKKNLKYTPPQYSIEKKISKKKLDSWRYKTYVKLLSLFPQVRLIGLSGSISMMNAREEDDIDLFIITAKNRLFTGRLIALLLAQILGIRRKPQINRTFRSSDVSLQFSDFSDKVCLNLFFDERDLKIPKFKQTVFVGHEVLQMKPIINKDGVYELFLAANEWVFKLFPNARSVFSMKYKVSGMKKLNTKYFILNTFFDKIETFLKIPQLKLINHHRTTEIITSSQLWFHPDDFEKRMKYS